MQIIVGLLLVCVGESELWSEKGLVCGVEKSKVVLSYGESLVLNGKSGDRAGRVNVGAVDFASVPGQSEACFVQDCKVVLCFEDVSAVAGDDNVIVAEYAVNVREGEAGGAGLNCEMEEAGNVELTELGFGIAEDVGRGPGGLVPVCGWRSWLEESWDAAKVAEALVDAGSWKEVGEVEKSDLKGLGGEMVSFEKAGEFVEVGTGDADEEIDTDDEINVPENIVKENCIKADLKARTAFLRSSAAMGRAEVRKCEGEL